MNFRSIRFRLVAWYAGLLACIFTAFGVYTYLGLHHYLNANLQTTLINRANRIADGLLAGTDKNDRTRIDKDITSLYQPEKAGRFIRVTDTDGNIIYESEAPVDDAFEPALIELPGRRGKYPDIRTWKNPAGYPLMIASISYKNALNQTLIVEVGSSEEPIESVLHGLFLTLALGLPLLVAAAAAGGYGLVNQALRPVDQITKAAEEITFLNLSKKLPLAKTGDELDRLSVALNRMIVRLEEAFHHNTRFMADASHELRTPLTIIRGELESVIHEKSLSPEITERIGTVLEEVDRLIVVVGGLFAISRLDAGEGRTERVRLNLNELVANTSDQMLPLAKDKGLALTRRELQSVEVEGDRARLKQIIVNLVDNAIKYTPSGGGIQITIGANRDKGYFEVADTGIGIPEEALPRVFERFFRADKARSRDLGGAGLGLSIVQSICAIHGGSVTVQSRSGHGARFMVELPLSHEKANGVES